ncbi:MAG: TonB-dependent receptor [Candidatus Marinimicrobia bacterium]|nr:TonB-dependent receptor [Candidatus Neomarinimicrobiota bacterium]
MNQKVLLLILILTLWTSFVFAGITGKISGRVTDSGTGQPLIGANIIIEGTSLGAASDGDGYFVILNIPPTTYSVKVSMIGYAEYVVENVRVEIDLTTTLNSGLRTEAVSGEQVVVTAERNVIRPDVAASQMSISGTQIEELPFATITDVLTVQAGIAAGLQIRGGSSNESLFMVDGVVLRDGRNSTPFTAVPLSAVQEISIQTGGFSPEYNNVRSGIVNVVTKEGSSDKFSGTITYKNSPAASKHFGDSIYDSNSFWLRPYTDNAVAWTGTKAPLDTVEWNIHTQKQYPEFEGWNAFSAKTLLDDDPSNDLTPAAAQRLFLWQLRKQGDIKKPDYNIDAGFGGPVPLLNSKFGNLRFFASYQKEQDMYLLPLSRDAIRNNSTMIKVTSDLSESMKLTITGLVGDQSGTNLSRSGGTAIMETSGEIAGEMDGTFTVPWRIYTNIYWSPTKRRYKSFSGKLTKVLSPSSFYEILFKRESKKYRTNPGALRDTTKVFQVFDGFFADEAPIGFWPQNVSNVNGLIAMGGAVSTARDTTDIITYTAKFDYSSQINRNNQIKAGLKFSYDDFNMRFGTKNEFLPEGNSSTRFHRFPYSLVSYFQDKIEYEGFIAMVGFNAEYTNPNGDWFDAEDYDPFLYSSNFEADSVNMVKADARLTISPRIGISHPITVNSKMYFNYGHYRQLATAERMYRLQRSPLSEQLDRIGDPTLPLEKTVSYELGYDHAVKDDYLVHLTAYYKDITGQEDWTRYISERNKVDYFRATNNSYEDIRGFELEITKMRGEWLTGNINYEYRVNTSGEFGVGRVNANPSEQADFENRNPPNQSKPLPRPRAKSYIDFHSPYDFGPDIAGQKLLGAWHVNLISRWTAGSWATWNPMKVTGITSNLQWKNFYNVDFKMSKEVPIGRMRVKLFLDIFNVFNIKRFSGLGFFNGAGSFDFDDYMFSLHLPQDEYDELRYDGIPGTDRPGEARGEEIDFVPMVWVQNIEKLENKTPDKYTIYYLGDTGQYMVWNDADPDDDIAGVWVTENQSRVDRVLENKAYIDMPNQRAFAFLSPRDLFYGINFTFDF